jgi:hypothetical protein
MAATTVNGGDRHTMLVTSDLSYNDIGSIAHFNYATLPPTLPPMPRPTPLPTAAPTLSIASIEATTGKHISDLPPQWQTHRSSSVRVRHKVPHRTADACSQYTSCESCINNPQTRCGFCGGSKLCSSGSDLGPTVGPVKSICEDNWSWTDCANIARDDDDTNQPDGIQPNSSLVNNQTTQLADSMRGQCSDQLKAWRCSGQSLAKCLVCAAKLEGMPACALLGPAFVHEKCRAQVPTKSPQKAPTRALVWQHCSEELREHNCLGQLTPLCVKCAYVYKYKAAHPPTTAPTNIPFRRRLVAASGAPGVVGSKSSSNSFACFQNPRNITGSMGGSHFVIQRICVANSPSSTAPTAAPSVAPSHVMAPLPTPCPLHLQHISATKAVVSACLRSVQEWCGAYRYRCSFDLGDFIQCSDWVEMLQISWL